MASVSNFEIGEEFRVTVRNDSPAGTSIYVYAHHPEEEFQHKVAVLCLTAHEWSRIKLAVERGLADVRQSVLQRPAY